MYPRPIFRIVIVLVCLLVSGCSAQPTQAVQPTEAIQPTQTAQAPEYIINQAEPTEGESALEDQDVELSNCDGKAEHNPLSTQAQVAQSVMIDDTAICAETGDLYVVSSETKAMLTEMVQQTYQQMYTDAKAAVDQTDLQAKNNYFATYTISWTKKTVSSTISSRQNGQTCNISYVYSLDIPKAIIKNITGCTG